MAQVLVPDSLHVQGSLSCAEFNCPAGAIGNADIEAAAGIDATKVQHQHALRYSTPDGTAITAATIPLHIAHGAGTVVSLEVYVSTLATDASRTVTIDLQKSTGGGAFSSVLNSVLVIGTSETARVPVAATINTPSYVDGDCFQLTVAVAGGSGSQAQGLCAVAFVREAPQ